MRDCRTKSGFRHNWSKIPSQVSALELVKPNAKTVSFRRVKRSYRGLSDCVNIRRLFAYNVDQGFLNELSRMSQLTYLWMETITANDLGPLVRLDCLEYLIMRRVHRAACFSFVPGMSNVRHLLLEHVKNLRDLEPISPKEDLISFGIEGSIDVTQKIDTLKPILHWKELNSLYLTNTKVLDGNLRCLSQLTNLRHLECARFYPKSEFDALKSLHPKLKCDWFDEYELGLP